MSKMEALNLDHITSLEELQELHLAVMEQERRRGLEDLYFFNKYILNYKDMEPKTHKPLCMFLDYKSKKRKKMIQLPRGVFKSSMVTIGYSIREAAKNPNIRILIDNEVYANSKAFLREIKSHIDDPTIQEYYPQLTPNKMINDGFTENSVIVKGRTKHMKEPTISCAGVDQIKVGMHYDLIIMDDLVSNRNVGNKEQIAKVIDHYKLALSLLEPDGILIIIGTRYHYADLYGYITDNEYDSFDHFVVPATLKQEHAEFLNLNFPELGHTYREGDLIFPERLTPEFLAEQKKSQGTYIYNCQYELDPVDQENADLSKEWLQYWRGSLRRKPTGERELVIDWLGDHDKNILQGYIFPISVPIKYVLTAWDPANKKKKRSDYTGASTVAISNEGDWFVLNFIEDKFNPREIVDAIFEEQERFEVDITGIEEEGKESIKFYLIEKMKQENRFFRLRELKSKGVKKEVRIAGRLVPRFEHKRVFLPINLHRRTWDGRVIDLTESFEEEYLYFPVPKKDNIIDSLAYIEDLTPKKGRATDGGKKRRRGKSRIISG